MSEDASSDPVATALSLKPRATFMKAYLKAVIPQRQIPAVEITSQGSEPSSPWTIRPCPGAMTSADVVPQHRHWISSVVKSS